jgi:hypothetical protein
MTRRTSASLIIALLIFGCACFSIAEFDPEVVSGAEALHQKFGHFLSTLGECAGTPEADYSRHTAFYTEAWQDLERLEAEARSRPHNELTLRSLEAIRDNLVELEGLHHLGISRGEVDVVARLFDTQFRMLVELENAKPRKEP